MYSEMNIQREGDFEMTFARRQLFSLKVKDFFQYNFIIERPKLKEKRKVNFFHKLKRLVFSLFIFFYFIYIF